MTSRRAVLLTAGLGAIATLLPVSGCTIRHSPKENPTMTDDQPTAEEALRSVGIIVPDAELTVSEGIVVSDLDEWSVRVSFSDSAEAIADWVSESFNGSEGLLVSSDGGTISQRFSPEEVHEGARYLNGSNPEDPSATYTVLISPEGTDVVIAAARTSR